jgi:hypothetical protein
LNLESVSIYGFRSLEVIENVPVGSPTVLAGHNDAGKTAILDAISYLLMGYQVVDEDLTYLDPANGVDPGTRASLLSVEGTFAIGPLDSATPKQTIRVRRVFESERSRYERLGDFSAHEDLRDLPSRTVAELKVLVRKYGVRPSGQLKQELLTALRGFADGEAQVEMWATCESEILADLPQLLRFDPVADSDPEAAIRAVLQSAYKRHLTDTTISGSIHDLEEELNKRVASDAEGIVANIQLRCPDIGSVSLSPEVSFSGGLRSTLIRVDAASGQPVGLGQAGTGRSRRIALAVWEHTTNMLSDSNRDVVVIYDEPDAHLDYHHQRTLMTLIREQCALSNVRMAIATHSMNLIDGIDISDVVHVKQTALRTEVEMLVDSGAVGDHLGLIARSLGLRNTVLLNERLFVGVEGVTEMAAFPILFRHVVGHALESAGLALWACGNNEGAMLFASYLTSKDRNVVFVIDEDSRQRRGVFSDDKLRQRGIDPTTQAIYIGAPNEFEELFPDDLWCTAANENWPKPEGALWEEAEIAALRPGKFSSDLLEALRVGSESGPQGKGEMGLRIALAAATSNRVPDQLVSLFRELAARAA